MFDIEHIKPAEAFVEYVSVVKCGEVERRVATDRIAVDHHGWKLHRRNINSALTEMGLPSLPEDSWIPDNHPALEPR